MFTEARDRQGKTWTRIALAATVFSTILGVSFGLCGLTFYTSLKFPAKNLGELGQIEIWGMVIGAVGLLIVGLVAVVMAVVQIFKKRGNEAE